MTWHVIVNKIKASQKREKSFSSSILAHEPFKSEKIFYLHRGPKSASEVQNSFRRDKLDAQRAAVGGINTKIDSKGTSGTEFACSICGMGAA